MVTYVFCTSEEMPALKKNECVICENNDPGFTQLLRANMNDILKMTGDFEEGSMVIPSLTETTTVEWSMSKNSICWDLQLVDGHGFSSETVYDLTFTETLNQWKETYDLLFKFN